MTDVLDRGGWGAHFPNSCDQFCKLSLGLVFHRPAHADSHLNAFTGGSWNVPGPPSQVSLPVSPTWATCFSIWRLPVMCTAQINGRCTHVTKGACRRITAIFLHLRLVTRQAQLSKRFTSLSFIPVRLTEEDSSTSNWFFQGPSFHCSWVVGLRKPLCSRWL